MKASAIFVNRLAARGLAMAVTTMFFLLVVASLGFAQTETGQIVGTVTDPNGALVPGATVVVRNVNTGREVTVTANNEGAYNVTNLQAGLYEVTTKAQGFQDKVERIQVTVGAKLPLNTELGVAGTGGETVTVVGGGTAEINTVDQQVSSVVTTQQITELPTLTRNPYDLVSLAGNVSDADPTGSTGRGAGFSINGQRSASTDILLDGAENVDLFTASIGQSTPLDSVGEFRVITGNFSAEYGRASGGIVNAITKAGTNDFHGTAYEFNRVSRLAANTFDNNSKGIKKGVFARNQYGYSIGGPIMKNKLFFFNSTEWIKVRSRDTVTAFIPTPGLISASSAATRNYFSLYGKLAGDVRPTGVTFGTNPAVTGPLYQQVTFTVPINAGGGDPQDTYQTVSRVDWNWTNKTQIFGRYAIEKNLFTPGNYDFSPYEGFTIGTGNFNQNALVNLTHQFTTNLVSQTKFVFNRLNTFNNVGGDPNTPTLSGNFATATGDPVYLPGFLSLFPGIGLPSSGPQNLGQINEDLGYNTGNHGLRFGGQYVYIQANTLFPAYQNASQIVGTSSAAVTAGLLAGTLAQFQGAVNPQGHFPGESVTLPVAPPDFSRSNRYNEFALYFNDSWRIRPRFTLNLGMRYEYYGVQHNKDQSLDSNFYFGEGATLQERVRNGKVLRAPDSPVGGLWAPDKNNFAPRLGFAWDVFGDGKTSIRGGYGIAYERNFGNVTFNVIQNPPNYSVLAITPADVGGTLPIFTSSAGPLAGTTPPTKVLGRVSLRAVDPHIRNAYSHMWSAAFEREIMTGTVASVTYSGSAGRDLYSIANLNRVNSGLRFLGSLATFPGFAPSNRLNGQFTDINFRGNDGYSNYNGVTFALDSNNLFGLGLTVTNRYTYSVAKDNLSSTFTDGYQGNNGYRLGFLDPYDPALDYGYADFDIRHRFSSSFVWDVPYLKNADNAFVRHTLGGWTLTGRFVANTGNPFTVFDGTNTFRGNTFPRAIIEGVNTGAPATLPEAIGQDTGLPLANTFVWINTQGLTTVGLVGPDPASALPGGQFGTDSGPYPANMSRRNAFRGPGYWNFDFGVYKNFSLTERVKMQLRGEFFNVFNHANLYINGASLDIEPTPESGFTLPGNVTASRGALTTDHRNIQLALKFIF